MASNLERERLTELVEVVLATPATSRKRAVNNVLEYLVTTNTLDMWGEALANQAGYYDQNGRQDIRSVIAEKLLVTLHAAQAGTTQRISNWAGFLYGISKNAVLDYLASGQVTVASGMSSATRRQTIVGVTRRKLLAELGREPTQNEIITVANAHVLATRVNPKKQGALITTADFDNAARMAVNVDEQYALKATDGAVDDIENRAEVSVAEQQMLRLAAEMYPNYKDMGQFIAAWMHLNLAGERVSLSSLGDATGMSKGATKRYFDAFEGILAELRAAV